MDKTFRYNLNFRDLGGLETNDNRKVKPRLFYRGSGLSYFTDEELEIFQELGIKTIMDLRGKLEIEKYPDPYIENVKRIEHNGLAVEGHEDIDWSPTGMKKIGGDAFEQINKIHGYYRAIAFDNEAFKIMIKEIEDENNLPIYFHCASGKDRTGVGAIVILMLLNVKEEEIRQDYLISNVYRKEFLDSALEEIQDQIQEHPELEKLIIMQQGVVEEICDIVINSIKEKYKTFDEYIMQEYSISKEQLTELRNKYLQ